MNRLLYLRPAVPSALLLLALTTPLAGCFNDAFSPYQTQTKGGGRLQLVIESDRTQLEGSHFLVDTATGDLWRLRPDASGAAHRWVSVTVGPTDVRELEIEKSGDSEDDSDG